MYNGVGLPTPRGSATSGRVQHNKFLDPNPSLGGRRPNSPLPPAGKAACGAAMAEHERKRRVEVRLLELREKLEEQGYGGAEVEALVAEARTAAEAEAAKAEAEEGGRRGTKKSSF